MSDPPPLVVKVGGGLLRDEGLDGLRRGCSESVALARVRPVLVVPGGGPFADAVRSVDAQVGLANDVAHSLALRAMDQLGALLAPMLPGAQLLARLEAPRRLGLLSVAHAFAGHPDVPESWTVTSDSLSVIAAGAIGAAEAILLKPVTGVMARWPSDDAALSALTADELEAMQGAGGGRGVDPYLPEAIRRSGVAVTVRKPGCTGAPGTRITRG